jgi:delta14-sterol reductase
MGEPYSPTDLETIAAGLALVFGFVAILFVASAVIPGPRMLGATLADGSRRMYVLNGFRIYLLTVVMLAAGTGLGWISLSSVVRHFWGLFIAANVLSVAMSVLLYVSGRRAAPQPHLRRQGWLALIRDFWMGVELNPTWFGVDVKLFSYRPSLLGLAIINTSFAAVQYQRYGELTTAMILYQLLTFIYVFNYFQFEYGMLHTWDIVAERFGFMLVWGDLAFVPFAYSIVGWFLVDAREPISPWAAAGLTAMFALGLWIFRGANQQKHDFKRDRTVRIWGKPAQTLGDRILVSGFWGIGRKLNYTGEIMVYWSFTLLSTTASFVPYLLPLWLTGLLVHRAWRDNLRCRERYGPLWDQYCEKARFHMIPFVY